MERTENEMQVELQVKRVVFSHPKAVPGTLEAAGKVRKVHRLGTST